MRSKTSFFNPTLFKKDLTRFWPLWGGASALGALAPLYLLMCLIDEGFRSYAGQGLEVTQLYYAALAYVVPVISLIYAALCALAVWGWLYNPRSVGLYHSLPITRKGLFTTSFLSGMAMMLIPYAVVGGLLVVISLASGTFEPVGVLVTTLGVLGETLFYFAAATAVVFVTGNPFAFAAFYFIFQFLGFFAEWLITMLMNMFYFGVDETYRGVASFLSPTIHLVDHVGVHGQYEQIVTADGWIEYGDLLWVKLANGWLIAVYALVGVVLLGCAWALYRRRRSECAGDVVAVGWMKPVFRYGVALCCGLAGGEVLYQILFEIFETGSTANAVPMAACMAAAGVIGYYIASMLLAKSIKVFRGGTWKGAVGTLLVSAAICGVIVLDPAGVESWVPSPEELEFVSIELHGEWGSYIRAEPEDPATVQKILDLHKTIIAEKDQLDGRGEYYRNISLTYRGRDGKSHWRRYSLEFSDGAQADALAQFAQLACDPVIQESNIFDNIQQDDIQSARLTGGYIEGLYNTETKMLKDRDLTREEAQLLEDAIRRDIAAGHFGLTAALTDYVEYTRTACRGNLQLHYNVTYKESEAVTYNDSTGISVNISTYCTETLDALKKLGVTDGTHKILTREEYQKLTADEDLVPDSYYDAYADKYAEYASYPEAVLEEADF